MKLLPQTSAAKKTMRVATVLTGVTAAATAFAPAATAAPAAPQKPTAAGPHAAGRVLRVREVSSVVTPDAGTEPYTLSVYIAASIYSFQVCGYKHVGGGKWTCTGNYSDPYTTAHWFNVGGNWNRGKINIWWNGHGKGSWDTCNTNIGGFYGESTGTFVGLTNSGLGPIGYGVPTC